LNVGDLEIEMIELHGGPFRAHAPSRRGTSPLRAGIKAPLTVRGGPGLTEPVRRFPTT
jgi:hypothetical protein